MSGTTLPAQVLETARNVRAAVEGLNARMFTPGLGGACGVASWKLTRELRAQGYPAEFVCGAYVEEDGYDVTHCWVELHGLVIDITATQFRDRNPAVWVRGPGVPGHRDSYVAGCRGRRAWREVSTWCGGQRPRDYRIRLRAA